LKLLNSATKDLKQLQSKPVMQMPLDAPGKPKNML